jgi:hypothetical protein
VRAREAELKRDRAIHGRFARLIEKAREAPARARKHISKLFTIPREGEEEDLVIKVKEKA